MTDTPMSLPTDKTTPKQDAKTRARIRVLKNRARGAYLHYQVVSSSAVDELNCGLTLATYLTPEISAAKAKFNAIMEELTRLDPDCPKERL